MGIVTRLTAFGRDVTSLATAFTYSAYVYKL